MFCKNCGTEIDESIDYCPNCGNKVVIPVDNKDTEEVTENKKSTGYIIIIALLIFIIFVAISAIVLIISIGKIKKDKVKEKEVEVSAEDDVEMEDINIYVYNANSSDDSSLYAVDGVKVQLFEGFDSDAGNCIWEQETDLDGHVVIDEFEKGEYTLTYSKDGYIRMSDNITIDDAVKIVKYIPQTVADGDLLVMTEWQGNHDIDISFMNAESKERVSVGNPMDKDGSFLYADNRDSKYEMVYIRDFSKDVFRGIYIVDSEAVNNSDSSSMEEDGLTVYVFEKDNCIYKATASNTNSESIWYPLYIYQGKVYSDEAGFYKASDAGFDWAKEVKVRKEVNVVDTTVEQVTETVDASTNDNLTTTVVGDGKIVEDFVAGKINAKNVYGSNSGKIQTFKNLIDFSNYEYEYERKFNNVEYANMEIAAEGNWYCLKINSSLYDYGNDCESRYQDYYILNEKNGELLIAFTVSGYDSDICECHDEVQINKYGAITFSSQGCGIGSYPTDRYAVNSKGSYSLFNSYEETAHWLGGCSLIDVNANNMLTYLADNNCELNIEHWVIDGKSYIKKGQAYYVKDYYEIDYDKKVDYSQLINSAASSYGVKFVTSAEVETVLNTKAASYGTSMAILRNKDKLTYKRLAGI